jgi:hypothetical protein
LGSVVTEQFEPDQHRKNAKRKGIMTEKEAAYQFLVGLQQHLNSKIPNPAITRSKVSAICNKPVKHEAEKLGQGEENIFLYHVALPEIVQYMKSLPGVDDSVIRQSLRGEYFDKFPHLFSGNTRRKQGHPFSKEYPFENNLEKKLDAIMEKWKTKKSSGYSANESYPDLCITQPFPFKIAFDAKYVKENNLKAAERQLVKGVYEVVHYRGQPAASPEYAATTRWGYDYGCLLAYDASEDGLFQQAWSSVGSKRLFWDDAHVFVMVLRPQATSL